MMTSANAYLQTHSDSEHRSRVMALYMAVFFGTTPVGAPLIGVLADDFGPRAALVIPGVASVLVTVALVGAYKSAARGGPEAASVRTAPNSNPTVARTRPNTNRYSGISAGIPSCHRKPQDPRPPQRQQGYLVVGKCGQCRLQARDLHEPPSPRTGAATASAT